MTNTITKRKSNKLADKLRNAPLIALTAIVSLSLEAFGWGYIFLTNTDTANILGIVVPLALVEAIIISATGFLALIAAFVAAERRSDPRGSQRRQAFAAQCLALVLLVPPMTKAAEAFAFPAQIDAYEAYIASPQYQADLAKANDNTLDSIAQLQAATSLSRAVRPTRATFDIGAWIWAAFIYGANLLAASLLWRTKPETAAERERRLKAQAVAKGRATRAANKLAKQQAEITIQRPSWFRGLFVRKVA